MARRTLSTTTTDVSALSANFPNLDFAAIDSAIADIPVRKIRTQATEALAFLPVAQYFASQRPDLAGAEIGQQIRAGYRGDFVLTPGFDREVARLLKDSAKAASVRPSKAASKEPAAEAAPAAPISTAAATMPRAEEMADLLTPVAQPRATRLPDAGTGAHRGNTRADRPYFYGGKFQSPVKDTGFDAVTNFYVAVESELSMLVLLDRAEAIRRNPAAEAAVRDFAKPDRDIFEAVVKLVAQ